MDATYEVGHEGHILGMRTEKRTWTVFYHRKCADQNYLSLHGECIGQPASSQNASTWVGKPGVTDWGCRCTAI